VKKILIAILVFILFITPVFAIEGVPKLLSIQGRFSDAKGKPVDGSADFKFQICTEIVGSTVLDCSEWEESHDNFPLKKGIFNILLGSTFVNGINFDFNQKLYLRTFVNNEMFGDVEIAANPYSMQAINANMATNALNANYATNAGDAINADFALNSDKLDGKDAIDFMSSDEDLSNLPYVKKTGDTMTGKLIMDVDGSVEDYRPLVIKANSANVGYILFASNAYAGTGASGVLGYIGLGAGANNDIYVGAYSSGKLRLAGSQICINNDCRDGWPDGGGDIDTNAGTLCNPGQYLDGDETCKVVPSGGSGGDMYKSTYDIDNDNHVDHSNYCEDAGTLGEELPTYYQKRVTGTCNGKVMTGINSDGTVTCETDNTLTPKQYTHIHVECTGYQTFGSVYGQIGLKSCLDGGKKASVSCLEGKIITGGCTCSGLSGAIRHNGWNSFNSAWGTDNLIVQWTCECQSGTATVAALCMK